MNLIDYSFVNNIEFGVYAERKILSINQNLFFESAVNTCFNTVDNDGYTIYVRRPKYEKKAIFIKNYVGSEVELNLINDLITFGKVSKKRLSDFINEKYVNAALKVQRKSREEYHIERPSGQTKSTEKKGFCIRCKTIINKNLEKPLCWECYKVWSLYEDPFYKENFCIACGETNDTNFNKPACLQCFKALQKK